MSKTYGFETLSIHAGAGPDPTTGARALPALELAGALAPALWLVRARRRPEPGKLAHRSSKRMLTAAAEGVKPYDAMLGAGWPARYGN